MAEKKFTTKKKRLRSRAKVRRRTLKVNPVTRNLETSQEQANLDVLRSIESKVKATVAAKA